MEPFLKTGMMSASLSLSGNVPNERQLLKQNVRNGAHDLAAILSTRVGIFPLTDF